MTFWATLMYAGSVVLTMGYDGMTYAECKSLTNTMIVDINQSYADGIMVDTMFPVNQFTVSCESEQLPLDEKYVTK